ncbi:MAG: hypothetical protein K2X66_04180 [Cyanobacteria bacterium]|nr:hypothetical protein [Cyanobacteriota bacterium]
MTEGKYRVFEIIFTDQRLGIQYFQTRQEADAFMKEKTKKGRVVHLEVYHPKLEKWVFYK